MHAEPIVLSREDAGGSFGHPIFHPNKPWALMSRSSSISFWPLPRRSCWVVTGDASQDVIREICFTPDNRRLVALMG